MNIINPSRRLLLKSAVAVPASAVLLTGVGWAAPSRSPAPSMAQQQHIVAILQRFLAQAPSVTEQDLWQFAAAYTERHGQFNHQQAFAGLDGQAGLVREFVTSTRPGVAR